MTSISYMTVYNMNPGFVHFLITPPTVTVWSNSYLIFIKVNIYLVFVHYSIINILQMSVCINKIIHVLIVAEIIGPHVYHTFDIIV